MEEIGTDERKPFEHEDAIKDEEETQPEPDEQLMMDQGSGRVWSVKVLSMRICLLETGVDIPSRVQVPKHLMEAWSMVEKDDVQLATIRVYNKDPRTGKQRIVMLVPSDPTLSPADVKEGDMDEYEMDMVNEAVENQIVVAEREKAPGSRARTTILTGRIKHDCNLRPAFTDKYRKRMRERTIKANTPARTIRMIDEVASSRGAVNILTSGMGPTSSTFSGLTVSYRLTKSSVAAIAVYTYHYYLPPIERQAENWERRRTLHAYASKPIARYPICAL